MLTFPPDFSFVIQIVSFLLLWAALKRLAFDPILRVIEERERRTHGGMAEAEALRSAAQAAEQQYDGALHDVRHAALVDAETVRQQAEAEHNRQIAAARHDADVELAKLRADIAAQVQQAQASLSTEARAIAALMAERVTGRSLA
ncbi:MAG TPA: ATP synthase F0 subunit B [Candidatus Kryptonia bacterium]|nr:ATP synthase F0 subunit B [Candidatus Kryptonia bacterium]